MNSKSVQFFTVGVIGATLISAGAITFFVNSRNAKSIRVESTEEFFAINQDLMPQTVQTIADSSDQNILGALLTGKEIPNTDIGVCIWARSDNENFQSALEDTSIDLELHYNKENSEFETNAVIVENGNELYNLYASVVDDKAIVYNPQTDLNMYTLTRDQFSYGLGTVTGTYAENDSNTSDNTLAKDSEEAASTDNTDSDSSENESVSSGNTSLNSSENESVSSGNTSLDSSEKENESSGNTDTDSSGKENVSSGNTDSDSSENESVSSGNTDLDSSENQNVSSDNIASADNSELTNILNIILTAVTRDNVQVTDNKSINLSHINESITGSIYSCSPSADDFENMLLDLADYMDTHESARAYIQNMIGKASELNSDIAGIEDLLVNKDNVLKDSAETIAAELSKSAFKWSVYSDENGNGRYLEFSFICKDIEFRISCEKSLSGTLYTALSLDDSFISIVNSPSILNEEDITSLGLSYGTKTITAGDNGNETKVVITTMESEGSYDDETVIEFYAGKNMGNVELHIQSSASSTIIRPEAEEEFQKDMTGSTDEEILSIFKTYKNGLTSILLSSKIINLSL